MRQVAKMIMGGEYKVFYDDKAKYNPYKVYRFAGRHRHKINEYADLASAMVELSNIACVLESYNPR